MTRTIFGIAALLAGAVALAGCGGSGSVHGSAGGTTAGVAGAHHTKASGQGSGHASGNFRANVHGFEAKVQASVNKFESGNVSGAAASGGTLLTNCTNVVNGKIAPQASTQQQKQAVVHLRNACHDMSKATNAGMSGNMTKAKAFARDALKQSQLAARLSG